MSAGTAFGSFLFAHRNAQGYERISDFLQHLEQPFTDNYYRDVEAGRKMPSVDAAVRLHAALDLEESKSRDYFWHYFRDVLPPDVHELLFGKRFDMSETELRTLNALRDYDAAMLRQAVALARYERERVHDDESLALLNANIELLPVMHFIYMVAEATESEIQALCKALDLERSSPVLARLLEILTTESVAPDGEIIYRRARPILRTPRNEAGVTHKHAFITSEVARSLAKEESHEFFAPAETFQTSGIYAIRPENLHQIQIRIVDLISELEVGTRSETQLDHPDADPYFVCLMISGRPEYNARRLLGTASRRPPERGG